MYESVSDAQFSVIPYPWSTGQPMVAVRNSCTCDGSGAAPEMMMRTSPPSAARNFLKSNLPSVVELPCSLAFISLAIAHLRIACSLGLAASMPALALSYTREKMRGTPAKIVGLSAWMSSISSLMLPWK